MTAFQNTLEFARRMDAEDPLRAYRDEFHFLEVNNKPVIYFTGNSLGLQPKRTQAFVDEIMEAWRDQAVEGHFHADKPWWDYHERLAGPLSKIVGASPREVSVMNTLTVNLHLLMVSFYRPTQERYKILCEEKAFPSDQYMLDSQVRLHGMDPKEVIVEVKRKPEAHHWETRDILDQIEAHANELALVFIGGVNYYNGQVFDMETITKAAKRSGALVGWDLAHAIGNVALDLHDWEVDFAAWCSYKYMNSGPGNASGIFVHEKHLDRTDVLRLEGWWGTDKKTRFQMRPYFEAIPAADAWQVSNPPILSLAPYLASLTLFDEVGMEAIITKRESLVGFLEFIIREVDKQVKAEFEIITPSDRGCQLSMFLHGEGKAIFDYLNSQGVITDWREPNVIRLAPAPLYCSYEDMYQFGLILLEGLHKLEDKN